MDKCNNTYRTKLETEVKSHGFTGHIGVDGNEKNTDERAFYAYSTLLECF